MIILKDKEYVILDLFEEQLKSEIEKEYPLHLVMDTYNHLKKFYTIIRSYNQPVMDRLQNSMSMVENYKLKIEKEREEDV